MQGDRKDQHSSHSLNQWKERFDLWHRHAGMLTRGEPYKLIGILNKEPRSLMTWFGPSPERGPGTQPTNSKWSFQFVQCIQSSFQLQFVYITVFLSTGQWPNITYITKSVPVRICYIQCVQSKGRQFLVTGQWPNITYVTKSVLSVQ